MPAPWTTATHPSLGISYDYPSAFGEEQAAAQVAIATQHKGSRDADTEVKQQVSGNASIRAAGVVEHLDVGFRQSPAPAFGSHVASEHIKRIVTLPDRAGCKIAGMALPGLGRSGKPDVMGAVRVCS